MSSFLHGRRGEAGQLPQLPQLPPWRMSRINMRRFCARGAGPPGKMCESERGSRHWICTCATHTPLWACTICFVACQKGFLIRVKNDTMLTWCPAMRAGGGGATHRGSGRQNRGCPVCSLFHVEHGRERECWFARVPGGFGAAAWVWRKARGTRCATARAGDGAATRRWAGRQIPGRVGARTRRGDQGGSNRAGRAELWARWGPRKPPDPYVRCARQALWLTMAAWSQWKLLWVPELACREARGWEGRHPQLVVLLHRPLGRVEAEVELRVLLQGKPGRVVGLLEAVDQTVRRLKHPDRVVAAAI